MKSYSSDRIYWLFLITPAVLVLSIFFIIPVIGGFLYSFTDWNGLSRSTNFIGLKNYIDLFLYDDKFQLGLWHTIVFSCFITVFQNVFGLILAIFMDKESRNRKFFRVVYYMPAVLSPVVVSYIWTFILNPTMGALNIFLKAIGLDLFAGDWLGNPRLALFSIASVIVWQFTGYSMIIYLAGLQGISQDIYESGYIDGTNAWQKFKYITFPLLAPAFTINLILTIINTLKAFDHIFVMTGGGPGYATEVISTLLYREAFRSDNMGYASSISVVLFIMITTVSLIMLRYLKRREDIT